MDDEDFDARELGHRIVDEVFSDAAGNPNQPAILMLKALGVALCNIALVKNFDVTIDEGLMVVGRHAAEVFAECKELDDGIPVN
jgi:hypothetical protein